MQRSNERCISFSQANHSTSGKVGTRTASDSAAKIIKRRQRTRSGTVESCLSLGLDTVVERDHPIISGGSLNLSSIQQSGDRLPTPTASTASRTAQASVSVPMTRFSRSDKPCSSVPTWPALPVICSAKRSLAIPTPGPLALAPAYCASSNGLHEEHGAGSRACFELNGASLPPWLFCEMLANGALTICCQRCWSLGGCGTDCTGVLGELLEGVDWACGGPCGCGAGA